MIPPCPTCRLILTPVQVDRGRRCWRCSEAEFQTTIAVLADGLRLPWTTRLRRALVSS